MDPIERKPVLTCWNDIARYVTKGVRTVQRWERDGIPCAQTETGTKSSVLAIPKESDAWVESQHLSDGQVGPIETERTMLFKSLIALRSENRELRRQLELERARSLELPRKSALHL
jgi:hypothetical protein